MTPKTLLWYLIGFIALSLLYFKRRIIFEMINEKIAFQQQYNQIHKEAYQTEKLKQAKVQGLLKARQPGLCNRRMVFLIGIVLIILLIIQVSIFISNVEAKEKAKKESCNKIGMENIIINGTEFCLDNNNKAHYVKIGCNKLGFKNYVCNPILISIGNIRTIQGGD